MDLLQRLVRGLMALGWLQSVSIEHRDSVPCLGSECSCSEQLLALTIHETNFFPLCWETSCPCSAYGKKGCIRVREAAVIFDLEQV